jgi:hypothetical protein
MFYLVYLYLFAFLLHFLHTLCMKSMLFADDVVLVDDSRTEVDQKLELWR